MIRASLFITDIGKNIFRRRGNCYCVSGGMFRRRSNWLLMLAKSLQGVIWNRRG